MVYYFAYGSNMNLDDLNEWCRRNGYSPIKPIFHKRAHLKGYKFDFNFYSRSRKGGALNIMSPGEGVCGVLFRLTKKDFEKISLKEQGPRKENAPYEKIPVTVEVEGEKCKADTFKVKREFEMGFQKPTIKYLRIVVKGAKRIGLPKECIDKIRCAAKGPEIEKGSPK